MIGEYAIATRNDFRRAKIGENATVTHDGFRGAMMLHKHWNQEIINCLDKTKKYLESHEGNNRPNVRL